MSVQFSSSTPAAPTGYLLVHWQYDAGTNTASAYVPIPVIFNWRGAWASGTAYAKYDAVSYAGSSYVALQGSTGQQPDTSPTYWGLLAQAGAQGATGATGPQGPAGSNGTNGTNGTNGQGFNFRGAWQPSTLYNPYDVVTNGGSTYEASSTFTSGASFNAANWNVWAQAGSNASIPIKVAFVISSGATGTNVCIPGLADRAGTLTRFKVVVWKSDPATDLTMKIYKNGVDVFSADPTIAHGAAVNSVVTPGTISGGSITVADGDLFTMDITSGSASWACLAQLES